jgi:hypothetical protein
MLTQLLPKRFWVWKLVSGNAGTGPSMPRPRLRLIFLPDSFR